MNTTQRQRLWAAISGVITAFEDVEDAAQGLKNEQAVGDSYDHLPLEALYKASQRLRDAVAKLRDAEALA